MSSCQNRVDNKIGDFIETHNGDTINISDFTDFKWDELWLIEPSMFKKSIDLMISNGIDVGNLTSIRKISIDPSFPEYATAMVFIHDQRIIYRCFTPLKRARTIDQYFQYEFEFPDKEYLLILSREAAVFKIKWRTLIPCI